MNIKMEPPFILMIQAAEAAVAAHPGKFNVISVSRDKPVDSKLCKNHLILRIDDFDTDDKEMPEPYRYAELKDIQAALDFDKKHKVFIIHCGAGVSRSPAIAYAIFRGRGLSKDDAMREVMERVPPAMPNKRIVKLTDQLFGD
jgi:predicted protein tyrosine phosphatase